ncbi:MAG TPA: M20/M25/M40 family metallo-hydrolase [Candidatus Dormibacteraeota bacterium]|nr:M20/M25/M40 family metallo-hydrolase [Candidatus Dormibacteraeota bacterium]
MFLKMATLSTRASDDAAAKLAEDPRCSRAFAWIERNCGWVTEQQIRLTEIPAPEFREAQRAEALKLLFADSGFNVRIDCAGNVVAERPGSDKNSVVLFAAHIDTVFPEGTDVSVRRVSRRLIAPGISDNGAGIAALVGLAQALSESRIQTEKTIVLAGDVGEEGEGNLRGIRELIESYKSRLSAVIAVDGPSTDYITTQGIASRRFEISIAGPGGHSWSNFGSPNPITALARGIVRFSSIHVPREPRSSFNFGVIDGGTTVNSIPTRVCVKVDLRSEDDFELSRLESALRESMQAGLRDELALSDWPADSLELNFRSLGARPAGKLPSDSPLLATIRNIDRFLGNRSRTERSSTDANLPLSLGIPAVALGGGGAGGGAHTPDEWFDPTGRELGLKRLFLIAIAQAGLQP